MNIYESSKRLKQLRKSKNVSHQELANTLHVSKQSLIDYEAAAREREGEAVDETKIEKIGGMAAKTLFKLSKYYGVTSDYLLGLSNSESIDEDENIAETVTGLSREAIKRISATKTEFYPARHTPLQILIEEVITSPEIEQFLWSLAYLKSTCKEYIPKEFEGKSKQVDISTLDSVSDLRKRLYGELWAYIESAKKLADDICAISEVEDKLRKKEREIAWGLDKRAEAEYYNKMKGREKDGKL